MNFAVLLGAVKIVLLLRLQDKSCGTVWYYNIYVAIVRRKINLAVLFGTATFMLPLWYYHSPNSGLT